MLKKKNYIQGLTCDHSSQLDIFQKKNNRATTHMRDGHWEGQVCTDQRKIYAHPEEKN